MKKILIVENNIELLQSLKRVLVANDYDVETTNDAVLGLSYALTKNYDLIIINLHLQRITAGEFINNLKRHNIDSLIIAMTSKEILSKKLLNYKVIANDYLILPFYTLQLLTKIKMVFDINDNHIIIDYKELKLDKFKLVGKEKCVVLTAKENKILELLFTHQQVDKKMILDFIYSEDDLWVYIDSLNDKLKKINNEAKIVFENNSYKVEIKWLIS